MYTKMVLSVLVLATVGCHTSYYCEDEWWDTGMEEPGNDAPPPIPDPQFSLSPDTIDAGAVIITSLTSDQPVDFAAIEEVVFYSEFVQVCTYQARQDELLVSIGAAGNAADQAVDMVIVFEDGQTFYTGDALNVLANDQAGAASAGASCAAQ